MKQNSTGFRQQPNVNSKINRQLLLTSPCSTIRYVNKPPMNFTRSETKVLVCNAAMHCVIYAANIHYTHI